MIEKDFDGGTTIIHLSGRLQSDHLDGLQDQVKSDHSRIALDLEGLTLVDVEMIRFLNACEESGIELRHCCAYIREWMRREKTEEDK